MASLRSFPDISAHNVSVSEKYGQLCLLPFNEVDIGGCGIVSIFIRFGCHFIFYWDAVCLKNLWINKLNKCIIAFFVYTITFQNFSSCYRFSIIYYFNNTKNIFLYSVRTAWLSRNQCTPNYILIQSNRQNCRHDWQWVAPQKISSNIRRRRTSQCH